MPTSVSLRWFAVSVFILSSTLNYLDRNLLNTLAPLLMAEFHLNQTGFGWLVSAFSAVYAVSALLTGWALDRFGVNRSIFAAVGWWSAAAIGSGLTRGFAGLVACRSALGIGESAGVSAVGKLNAIYLKPEERALGAALNQIGLSLGAALAGFWGVRMAAAHGWRWPFVIAGVCGFAWLPLWWLVSRLIPAQFREAELASGQERRSKPSFSILRDRNLLLLVLANLLWMGSYSLWFNWTTLYLTHVHHVSLKRSADYVWIPPLVSNAGGFFGGWLSLRWAKGKADPIPARRRAVWVSAVCSLVTLLLPFAADVRWATALISASFFFVLAGSSNIYTLPVDIYGAQRSGMALAALTCSYGLLTTLISPLIGYLSDHQLYTQVVWLVTLPLILSALVLQGLRTPREEPLERDRQN